MILAQGGPKPCPLHILVPGVQEEAACVKSARRGKCTGAVKSRFLHAEVTQSRNASKHGPFMIPGTGYGAKGNQRGFVHRPSISRLRKCLPVHCPNWAKT